MHFRNEAFLARTLIAVIDHNTHLFRNPSLSLSGNLKHHKVYSKRSKNWRIGVVKEAKSYDFWHTLATRIVQKRLTDEETVLRKVVRPSYHPIHIAPSIAMKPIPSTSDLVQKSLSRFSNGDVPPVGPEEAADDVLHLQRSHDNKES